MPTETQENKLVQLRNRCEEKRVAVGTHDDKNKYIEMKIVVEECRFYFYLLFCFITLLGYILSNWKTESYFGCDKYPELLTSIFGSLSICYVYDFPPSTYVLPFLYSFVIVFVYIYAIASIFRAWIAKEEAKITRNAFHVYCGALIYVALSASIFCTIFAVPPNPGEDYLTIHIHTIPYTNLCVALGVLQIAVTWFGTNVAWLDLKAPIWLRLCSLFYVSLLQITVISKIILHINALSDIGPCDPGPMWKEKICNSSTNPEERIPPEDRICGKGYFWDVKDPMAVLWSQMTEHSWRLTGILCPLIQSGYFWFQRFKTHCIIFSVRDNKNVQVFQEVQNTKGLGDEKITS